MKRKSILFTGESFRFSRTASDATGITLRVEHLPSGLAIERAITFEKETEQRRMMLAELQSIVERRFPPADFVIRHLRRGPGLGAALVLRHLPTGLSVQRVVGYDPQDDYVHEMLLGLMQKLRLNDDTRP